MSQLLLRIDLALQSERDAIRRAELLARRAAYLARIGQFSESRLLVANLRETFGDGRSGRTTVWIMLAEGLTSLFESVASEGLDRIARAQLLASAMADRELTSIASAWKAHYEFETSDFPAMLKSLALAKDNIESQNFDALTRLSMVYCNVFLYCGDRTSAEKWFRSCRESATSAGDQASVEALLYNRAAFGVSRLRAWSCVTSTMNADLTFVRNDVSNAINFQSLTRVAALTNLVHLSDARLLILERKFDEAIEKLSEVRGTGPFAKYNFSQSLIDLEIAYCHFMRDRRTSSLAQVKDVTMSGLCGLDLDERLVATSMLCHMSSADSRFGNASDYAIAQRDLSAEYETTTAGLCQKLRAMTSVSSA